MSFFEELKRRNVFRVAAAYLVFGWLVLQIGDVLFPALHLPAWSITLIAVLLGIGLIAALIFSWVYEVTPDGLKRESEIDRSRSITHETGRKLDMLTVALLVLAIGALVLDRWIPEQQQETERERIVEAGESAAADSGNLAASKFLGTPVIAVLPFKATGSDDGGFLATGLHDDLLTRLAKLDAFRVISRTSMMEYADTTKNMRVIGEELGAGYILEGGVQAMGSRVRINAQLIDAPADEHIWAEVFDREMTANNLFDVQAELAVAIANALHSQLSASDLELVNDVPTENMEAYNAYLRGLQTYETTGYIGTRKDHEALEAFEEAVRLDPGFALAWAGLATARIRAACCDWEAEEAEQVLDALNKARELKPGMLESELAWAEYLYRFRNEYRRALEVLESLGGRLEGNGYALQMTAWLNRRLGRYETGYRALQSARRLQPRSASIYFDLIHYAWLIDDCAAAGRFADQLLSIAPDAPASRVRLAEFELECNGDADRAVGLMRDVDFADTGGIESALWAAWHARDADLLLRLNQTEFPHPAPEWPFWQQWNQALVYSRLESDADRAELALARAGRILNEHEIDPALERRAEFAEMKFSYHALDGDLAETRGWIDEHRHRLKVQLNRDIFEESRFHSVYAWCFALAGAYDEAIEELRMMLEEGGGHRFPFVKGAIPFDALEGHPAFVQLEERFGN
jgi:TolB-like protein